MGNGIPMYYCGPDFPAVRQAIKETLYATGIDLIVLEEGLDTRAVSRKEVEDYFEAKRCEMHAEIMFAWRKKQGAGFRLTNSVPFGYIRRNGESKKAIEVVRAERSVQMKSVLAELNMEQFRRVPLYESYMANEITEEQYHAELMDYEEAHRKLNEQLTAIMEDTLVWERALSLRNPWIQQVAQYKAPEELDRSFVKKYIEQVTVTLLGDGQAEIGLTMKTYEWKQMLGRIETEETDDGTKE